MFHAIEDFAPNAHVTMADKNPEPINALIAANSPTNPTKMKTSWTTQAGPTTWLRDIDSQDVIIKSPGIPPSEIPANVHDRITTSTQIFLDSIPEKTLVIGITGTKGKSTTTSLIAAILKEAGKDVHIVGNIGDPAIGHLQQIKESTIVVQEMSSYQLMDAKTSPDIAVVTSFFPEHLDYHGTLEAYREAKGNITKFQSADDTVFYAHGSDDVEWIASQGKSIRIPVTSEESPVSIEQTWLIGQHNLSNIALAWKVCEKIGIDKVTAIVAIKKFEGLPHRLMSLGVHHGIEWVDDAISTTPQSAVAALDALGDRVKTIFLGGQDRGVDFAPLIKRLASSSVENAILFPGSGERIAAAMDEAGIQIAKFHVTSMEEAVKLAILHTPNGSVCLLSPASPSYGMFKNFEEKGDRFAQLIKQ